MLRDKRIHIADNRIMNSIDGTENIVSLDEGQGESVEKENKFETRINTSLSGKGTSDSPIKIPSNLITFPSTNNNKSDFGPLSPVQLNIGSNHANKERTLPKTSAVRSRQEKLQKGVGVTHQQKPIETIIKDEFTIEECKPEEDFVYDEGLSLMGEVAIFADAEEQQQLKKIMLDDENNKARNKTILDQSKKLVDFLGGSIKTALQQNSETAACYDDKVRDVVGRSQRYSESAEALSEDPSLQRLNHFVGDLIGKLGSINTVPTNNGNATQSTFGTESSNIQLSNEQPQTSPAIEPPEEQRVDESTDDQKSQTPEIRDEESPISQPKSKYWETLMLRSEESKDVRYGYCDSPCPSSLNDKEEAEETTPFSVKEEMNQTDDEAGVAPRLTIMDTPCVDKKSVGSTNEFDQNTTCENEPSPQSMISVPMDYSPGESAFEFQDSPCNEGIVSREDNSPGSMMFNMISAATNVETPLVCKTRLSMTNKSGMVESSPAISDFGNMISSSTAAKTPDFDISLQNKSADTIPDASNFKNSLVKSSATRNQCEEHYTEQMSILGDTQAMVRDKLSSKTKEISSSSSVNLLDKTPIKSNRREIFTSADSDSFLHSDCDESEDGSIYTSFSYQSSIQSNTPRSRRITEWLDPNASNTVSWPTPSMTTNIRSSETPERQLPATKYNEKPITMGTGQYLTLQKQIRTKSKSAQKADWKLHRPLHVGHSTSPNSLPSLLGSTACNEVSDLESPNIINFPLNFKFSDEESTIHSQSVHESSEIQSVHDTETQQHIASPQSLMTVATPTPETSKILCILGDKIRLGIASPQSLMTVGTPTVGYPTDEECSNQSKSPKDISNRNRPTPRANMFLLPTFTESSSPQSTDNNEGFKHDITDDKIFGYAKCLKRCIAFGMLVAFVGAVTVLVTTSLNPSKLDRPSNSDEGWENEIWRETSSPTSGTSLSITFDSPTLDSTLLSTLKPTIVAGISPTQSPVVAQNPTLSPSTKSPNAFLRPTTNKADSTVKPTAKPTSKPPMSIPTFSSEEIADLTWHRIVNGENIWRNSEKKPLWFLAADNTPGINLKVVNAARDDRLSEKLQIVVDDYHRSKAVSSLELTKVPYEILCAPPEIGEIKVCSGDYGNVDWIGSTILFMRDDYIVSALIRINESSSSPASDALLQYELCHQFGHSLGVVHNHADLGLSSCMKDFGDDAVVGEDVIEMNQKLQHPNSDDLDYLVTLYGTYSSSRMLRRR